MEMRNEILRKWEDIIDNYDPFDDYELDFDEMKTLIYNTYEYFHMNKESDTILRVDLPIYRCISQFELIERYPKDWTSSMLDNCADFILGLRYVLENGFDAGYKENPLPLGLGRHTPAGCADQEADMTSFDTYSKDFDDQLGILREEYEEDEQEG